MIRRLLVPALALVVGTGGFLACSRGGAARSLKLSGNIEVIKVEVAFRVAGKVLERPVDEGQLVQEGQLLARLDAKDLEQQLAIRAAEATVAEAALRAALRGSRTEEIEASRNNLEQARADLRRLEPDEVRLRDLREKGIVSQRDYESIRAALEAARAKAGQAEQQFALVKKGPRQEDLDQIRARAEQAHQAMALAKTQLGYGTVLAPCPGVVLSKNVEPNEYVAPGTSVVTLADLKKVWLRAYIEESELGRVKVGQRAWITSDSFPGKKFEGRVAFVASEAEFTPKSVQTRKERVKLVYRIKIDLPNPTMELKPGMPVDGEIELESH